MLLDQVSRTKGLAGQPQQGYVLRMFIGLRSAVYVAVLATAASAQTNTGCLHRIFPVTVADKHGNEVAGLPISDFRAEVEHRPVKLLPVALPTQQPRVVVLLDTSTSITPGGRIPIYPWSCKMNGIWQSFLSPTSSIPRPQVRNWPLRLLQHTLRLRFHSARIEMLFEKCFSKEQVR